MGLLSRFFTMGKRKRESVVMSNYSTLAFFASRVNDTLVDVVNSAPRQVSSDFPVFNPRVVTALEKLADDVVCAEMLSRAAGRQITNVDDPKVAEARLGAFLTALQRFIDHSMDTCLGMYEAYLVHWDDPGVKSAQRGFVQQMVRFHQAMTDLETQEVL